MLLFFGIFNSQQTIKIFFSNEQKKHFGLITLKEIFSPFITYISSIGICLFSLRRADALASAAGQGNTSMLQLIIDDMKELDIRDDRVGNALYEACTNAAEECVRLLLKKLKGLAKSPL